MNRLVFGSISSRREQKQILSLESRGKL